MKVSPVNQAFSEKFFFGAPKITIQYFIKIFAQWLLLVITAVALNFVNSSIIHMYHKPGCNWCKCNSTVSLKSSAFKNASIVCGDGFLNLIQVSYKFTTFLMDLLYFHFLLICLFHCFSVFLLKNISFCKISMSLVVFCIDVDDDGAKTCFNADFNFFVFWIDTKC